jgi:hypothetical protein
LVSQYFNWSELEGLAYMDNTGYVVVLESELASKARGYTGTIK